MTGAGQRARGVEEFFAAARADVERRLQEILADPKPALDAARTGAPAPFAASAAPGPQPFAPPPRLLEAMRYAVLGGGKRLRPLLVLASGEVLAPPFDAVGYPEHQAPLHSDDRKRLVSAACAVELIHAFSLIHDDLPALDNDDLRRGRPSLHVQFDEATAILAGDALLNMAYEVLSRLKVRAATRVRAIRTVAMAVGTGGMIAGQVLDLEAEGRAIDGAALHTLHRLKTGALFTACCELGGLLMGGNQQSLGRLRTFGERFGLAFQIVDDILDVEGSAAEMGKSPGKDARAGKATFPALWGVDESRRRAQHLVEEACAALTPFGRRAGPLVEIARGMLTRRG